MSTNARITVQHADSTVSSIYLHWSGYVANAGRILQQHYNTLAKAEALVALGDLSQLGANLEPSSAEHCFNNAEADVCVAYARDRGETGVDALKFNTLAELRAKVYAEQYNYFFINNAWYLCKYEADAQLLADVIANIHAEPKYVSLNVF